jgi:hypothetical protein
VKLHGHHHHQASGGQPANPNATDPSAQGAPQWVQQIMQALQQIMQELQQMGQQPGAQGPAGANEPSGSGDEGDRDSPLGKAVNSALASGDPKVPGSLLGMLNHPQTPPFAKDALKTQIANAMPLLSQTNPMMFNQFAQAFGQVAFDANHIEKLFQTPPTGTA